MLINSLYNYTVGWVGTNGVLWFLLNHNVGFNFTLKFGLESEVCYNIMKSMYLFVIFFIFKGTNVLKIFYIIEYIVTYLN